MVAHGIGIVGLTLSFSVLLASCGGQAPAPRASEAPASAPAGSAEEECLREASAPREPRADAPAKIGVSHVLVRHRELKRPEGATRSRGQACLRAKEAREKLLGGAEWEAIVEQYSDAGGASAGKLGSVAREELDATFADAAFALDVGELSHVVESPRGFHVIARNE